MTIFYRRTRDEMPAFPEEIEAALQEGVRLETLVSPIGILSERGKLSGIECVSNELGDIDQSGRRRPVAVPGTQHIDPAADAHRRDQRRFGHRLRCSRRREPTGGR